MDTRACTILLAGLLAVGTVAHAADSGSVTVDIQANAVNVTTSSRGGQVVLLGAAVETYRGTQTVHRFAEALSDTDGDGKMAFEWKRAIPFRSVWVAVDRSTGAYAVNGPATYDLMRVPFPNRALKKNAEDAIDALEQERPELGLLLVRPGEGAWRIHAVDGGKNDVDPASGRMKLVFEAADALGDTKKPPKHLKRGDVVAAIDPIFLEVFVGAIEK